MCKDFQKTERRECAVIPKLTLQRQCAPMSGEPTKTFGRSSNRLIVPILLTYANTGALEVDVHGVCSCNVQRPQAEIPKENSGQLLSAAAVVDEVLPREVILRHLHALCAISVPHLRGRHCVVEELVDRERQTFRLKKYSD